MRKIGIALGVVVVFSLMLGVMSGAFAAVKYAEAPELAALVKAGKLPPVEKRLPEEPLVLKPFEEIGQYGGVLKTDSPADVGTMIGIMRAWIKEPLVALTDWQGEADTVIPNVAKSWKVSADNKSVTFFLRKGMKWSDGEPFTAGDILFWYKDIVLNKELTPAPPDMFKSGEEIMSAKMIDDYTITFSFVNGTIGPLFMNAWATWLPTLGWNLTVPYAPAHYLKQFHPTYTDKSKIDAMLAKEKVETWVDLFTRKANDTGNPDNPTIGAWVPVNRPEEPVFVIKRNPYYWKVDTQGNQLPYINEIDQTAVADEQARILRVLAGDTDYGRAGYLGNPIENLSLFMASAQKGDYRIVTIPTSGMGNNGTIFFNYTDKDPVLAKLFANLQFRIALSEGLDREEINQLVYNGAGTPSQVCPPYGPPYHGELPMWKQYTQYNPDHANMLLDAMGLTARDKQGFRLKPDGKDLTIVVCAPLDWPSESIELAELYKKQWEKIGIRTVTKGVGAGLWWTTFLGGNYDLAVRVLGLGGFNPTITCSVFPTPSTWQQAPEWAKWLQTGGKEGVEPTVPEIKTLYDLGEKAMVERDTAKRLALVLEGQKIHADNIFVIGVIKGQDNWGYSTVKNNIKNVTKPDAPDIIYDVEWWWSQPSTWFIKK